MGHRYDGSHYTDSALWRHVPWYSLEHQDIIETDSLNLYGHPDTGQVYAMRLLGQKQQEVIPVKH